MGRYIHSPVKRWSGAVVLPDVLTFPQAMAFEDALKAVNEMDEATQTQVNYALLPAIIACVEDWQLDSGFPKTPTPDTFPRTPATSSNHLVAWLVGQIVELYKDAEEIPNA